MGLHRGNPPKSPFFKGGLVQTKLITDKFLVIPALILTLEKEKMHMKKGFWFVTLTHKAFQPAEISELLAKHRENWMRV